MRISLSIPSSDASSDVSLGCLSVQTHPDVHCLLDHNLNDDNNTVSGLWRVNVWKQYGVPDLD